MFSQRMRRTTNDMRPLQHLRVGSQVCSVRPFYIFTRRVFGHVYVRILCFQGTVRRMDYDIEVAVDLHPCI